MSFHSSHIRGEETDKTEQQTKIIHVNGFYLSLDGFSSLHFAKPLGEREMQQKLLKKSHIFLGWNWFDRITVISWSTFTARDVMFQVTLTVMLFALC